MSAGPGHEGEPARRGRDHHSPLDLGNVVVEPAVTADESGPDGSRDWDDASDSGMREEDIRRERPPHHGD